MKLYLITAPKSSDYWDKYDSAVVAAKSPADARKIHPSDNVTYVRDGQWMGTYAEGGEWILDDCSGWVKYAERKQVKVKYLGETKRKRGLILASYTPA